MWRRWLIQHAERNGGHGGETVRGETHRSRRGRTITASAVRVLRAAVRSNSRSTRYERYQHEKHTAGAAGAETLGAEDTLSPGREKLHDEAGDFKLERGRDVALGLANRPSAVGWRNGRRVFGGQTEDEERRDETFGASERFGFATDGFVTDVYGARAR